MCSAAKVAGNIPARHCKLYRVPQSPGTPPQQNHGVLTKLQVSSHHRSLTCAPTPLPCIKPTQQHAHLRTSAHRDEHCLLGSTRVEPRHTSSPTPLIHHTRPSCFCIAPHAPRTDDVDPHALQNDTQRSWPRCECVHPQPSTPSLIHGSSQTASASCCHSTVRTSMAHTVWCVTQHVRQPTCCCLPQARRHPLPHTLTRTQQQPTMLGACIVHTITSRCLLLIQIEP